MPFCVESPVKVWWEEQTTEDEPGQSKEENPRDMNSSQRGGDGPVSHVYSAVMKVPARNYFQQIPLWEETEEGAMCSF